MGYTPRDTYGGGSSESRESVQGNRERIDRDRDRDRNRNNSSSSRAEEERKAQEEAARKAKENSEREAREKAEREAREKAKREAEEKARKEAEAKAKEEANAGFSPMGGLSSYGLSYANGGRGILANMRAASNPEEAAIAERMNNPTEYGSIHFREPTQAEKNAGAYTNETAYAGQAISQDTSEANIARLTGDAIDEKGLDIATDFITSPAGMAGKAFSEVSKWARDLFDSSTDWEKAVKGQAKKAMSGDGLIGNVVSGTQGATMVGSLTGNGLAQSLSPVVSSTPVTAIASVADDAYAMNNWLSKNKEYLEKNGLINDTQPFQSDRDNSDRRTQGILANMVQSGASTSQEEQQTELPSFEWASGDDFKFNYGMGFKR